MASAAAEGFFLRGHKQFLPLLFSQKWEGFRRSATTVIAQVSVPHIPVHYTRCFFVQNTKGKRDSVQYCTFVQQHYPQKSHEKAWKTRKQGKISLLLLLTAPFPHTSPRASERLFPSPTADGGADRRSGGETTFSCVSQLTFLWRRLEKGAPLRGERESDGNTRERKGWVGAPHEFTIIR